MSFSFPLKKNADVLEATLRPGMWARVLVRSSDSPSLKYSFSGSPLRFSKARTAIDGTRRAILDVARHLTISLPSAGREPEAVNSLAGQLQPHFLQSRGTSSDEANRSAGSLASIR